MPELKHTRFGDLKFAEEDIVTFSDGLIGFGSCNRFIIVSTANKGSFRWLQSLDEPSLAFLVVDPAEYVEGYSIELADTEASSLGIESDTATLLFTTASIPSNRPHDMTINLAGPIVINAESRIGRQVIVDDEGYAVKHRVFEDTAAKAA
jgi:flagellar assembly factor FliW